MKHVRPLAQQVKYAADDESSASIWIGFVIDVLQAIEPVVEELAGKDSKDTTAR